MNKKYIDFFGDYLVVNKKIDLKKLPSFYEFILEGYFKYKEPNLANEIIVTNLNSTFSHILTHYRTQIINIEREVYPNYYAIIFAPSGEGKDRIFSLIRNVFIKDFELGFESDIGFAIKETKEEKLESYKKLYMQENKILELGEQDEKMLKKEVDKLFPVIPKVIINDATSEGFIASRETFQTIRMGASMVKMSELGDYLLSRNENKGSIIPNLVENWEDGEDTYKAIKYMTSKVKVKNVPSNLLAYSSLDGLKESKKFEEFIDSFGRGLARRTMVCMIKRKRKDSGDTPILEMIEKRQENIQMSRSIEPEIISIFKEYIKNAKEIKKIIYTKDANDTFIVYKMFCTDRLADLPIDTKEAVISEIKNRYTKVLKLSGIIAFIDGSSTVENEHVLQSIYQVEYFGQFVNKLIMGNTMQDLYEILKRKKELTQLQVFQILSIKDTNNGTWKKEKLDEIYYELQLLGKDDNLDIKIGKRGTVKRIYVK